jgi:hypothetical protein
MHSGRRRGRVPDVDKVLAGLVTIKVYFETKADSEANYGKWLMLHWAEVCRDAAELIESMKGEASDG